MPSGLGNRPTLRAVTRAAADLRGIQPLVRKPLRAK